MKNRILLFIVLLPGFVNNLFCSIKDIVQELSAVPVYDTAIPRLDQLNAKIKEKLTHNRLLNLDNSNNPFEEMTVKVKNKEEYVSLVYKFFMLVYGIRSRQSYTKDDYSFEQLKKQNKISDPDLIFALKLLGNDNIDFNNIDDASKPKLLHDLKCCSFIIYSGDLGYYVQSDHCIAILINSISERNIQLKDGVLGKILKTIKEIEDNVIWRILLFNLNRENTLTLENVSEFFKNNHFKGKQFTQIANINDIRKIIEERIKLFQDNKSILEGILKKLHNKQDIGKEEQELLKKTQWLQLFIDPKIFDIRGLIYDNYREVINLEKKNLDFFIKALKENLKLLNDTYPPGNKLYWGLGIGTGFLALILFGLKKAGHSIDPRVWLQKFRNR